MSQAHGNLDMQNRYVVDFGLKCSSRNFRFSFCYSCRSAMADGRCGCWNDENCDDSWRSATGMAYAGEAFDECDPAGAAGAAGAAG